LYLEYAILGFLKNTPLSGYDLKKQFDHTVQHFWSADQSQIYRVLANLQERELVTQEVIEQETRPDRKVYHITEKGKEALSAWLRSEISPPIIRSGPMIQIFFGAELSDDEILNIIETQTQFALEGLELLDQGLHQEKMQEQNIYTERELYMHRLTLEFQKRVANVKLEFADEIIKRLKNGEFPQK
jgi:DNA-binding PadR family transcriptional regulator